MMDRYARETRFESFVNSEECKTSLQALSRLCLFESFVNSEECKTISLKDVSSWRLRALLIQKSVKLNSILF